MKTVSVIVTSYNQVHTITHTLDSILTQKCRFTFEIIIGDDCSTDGTLDIICEYHERYPGIIKPIFHKENIGIASNFANCVKQAKGEYIAICAADDFWHNPDKLHLQIDFFKTHPDYGLLYTDYNKLNIETGKTIKDYLKTSHIKIYEGAGLINAFFIGKVPALTLTVMFRKELFDIYVPAEDYIKYRFPLEDWPTWLILSKHTKIGYLPFSTGTYRYGHESISHPLRYEVIQQRFSREKTMYKYLCDMFPDDLFYNELVYDRYVNNILLSLAYKKSDFNSATKYVNQLKELGSDNLRIRMAQNLVFFHIFSFLKRIKQKLTTYQLYCANKISYKLF